jgi:two-component system, sensor histidine kinase and response regulator
MPTEDNPNDARVLLVDDDEDDYLIIKKMVTQIPHNQFLLDWVADFDQAATAIKKGGYDIYVIDYRLRGRTGIELLEQFNLVDRSEPFIILTGVGDERVERRAMAMGAADYLVKGKFDAELLARVLRYSIQRKILESQRIQQLIELNRSKDEFIALASHQLRTPATAVKQYLGLLLEGYGGFLNEQQLLFVQTAYNSNERQLGIVNEILRVAQLDLEKISLHPLHTNLTKLVESVVQDFKPQFDNRRQPLAYQKPHKPLHANVDYEFFRMALGNIIDNATKYTPEGKAVTIRAGTADGRATISVEDEGVGIAPEDHGKLFKKFSRIDNPLSVSVGGTGLGLYWASEIIRLHGGMLSAQSELNKGTTFIISLPAAE